MGAFYHELSDALRDSLDPFSHFGNEATVEAFYSWAVTPLALHRRHVQYLWPARKRGDPGLLAAVRANLRF